MCVDYVPAILLLALIAWLLNAACYKRKFYTLPVTTKSPSLSFFQVLGCFGIYFLVFLLLAQFLFESAPSFFPLYDKRSLFALAQIFSTFLCFFFFGFFLFFSKKMLFPSSGKTLSSHQSQH